MRISTIAFANLKRRKGKAAFLALGIAIGIGTVVALVTLSGAVRREIGTQLDQFGANIVIVPKSDSLALDYGGVSVPSVAFDVQKLTGDDAASILDIPYGNRLSVVAPKLLGVVEAGERRVLLAGVDFDRELRLKRWWRIVGRKPAGERELLVGYDAARALGLVEIESHDHHGAHVTPVAASNVTPPAMPDGMAHGDHDAAAAGSEIKLAHDRLTLAGAEHPVAGVLAPTGGPEDRMVFGSLTHVQSLLNRPGELSLIEVAALCKDCPVQDIVDQIGAQLPHAKASAIQQSVVAREETVARLTRFSGAVAGVVLAIAALLIFTTMTGAVVERTKEIGVLRAIGFRKAHVAWGLVIEVSVISLLGGLTGWMAGTAVGWGAMPYFAEVERGLSVRPSMLLVAVAAAFVIGIVSSFYPILRASRLDPSEAVRYV